MSTIPTKVIEGAQKFAGLELSGSSSPLELLRAGASVDASSLVRDPEAAGFLVAIGEAIAEASWEGVEESAAGEPLLAIGATLRAAIAQSGGPGPLREAGRAWLNLVRRRPFPQVVAAAGRIEEAMEIILALIRGTHFSIASLLAQRVEDYGPRTLFELPSRGHEGQISWLEVSERVDRLARGLHARLAERGEGRVALLARNSYEMALADLACLTSRITIVVIPPTSTPDHVSYILKRTGARMLLFNGDDLERLALRLRPDLPDLHTLVRLDESADHEDVRSLTDIYAAAGRYSRERLAQVRDHIDVDELATIMVTSGTTGRPKGIRFTALNLVSKRFARSFALPEIGDKDVFLCYLPLFHTFGRYLEMLGCIFWGARYVFMEDPSLDVMLERFARYRPTVMISIPKKWIELYEEIGRRADIEHDSDEALQAATRDVLGDRMRWGLSAAGFLDPEIFTFFQRQGIELMSGFGMTEATGGITMTPPGGYRHDTLGIPLPAIDVELAEDGEMRIRGPYVMQGYLEPEDEKDVFEQGWLRTGDLMMQDEEGYYRILDRKKEIYKNVKGQTIAPQRIERLFDDFDAAKRVFLVGDHREFNTLLIVPNLDYEEVPLRSMDDEAQREYFRSLVVSVNRFLSPYERVIDFALLPRDFSEGEGELTPKGTYKRRAIADHFDEVIERFYKQVPLRLPGHDLEIKLPNRLFQTLGVTTRDIQLQEGELVVVPSGRRLSLRHLGKGEEGEILRIGSHVYHVDTDSIDLGQFLTCPRMWLGNEELVAFSPMETSARMRRRRPPRGVRRLRVAAPERIDDQGLMMLRAAVAAGDSSLDTFHLAARALNSERVEAGLAAVELLSGVEPSEDARLLEIAHFALREAADAPLLEVRRHAFCALMPIEEDARARASIEHFLSDGARILDETTVVNLARQTLSPGVLQDLVEHVKRRVVSSVQSESSTWRREASSLLHLLGRYGAEHPVSYRPLRRDLARIELFSTDDTVRVEAARAREILTEGFRRWLGPPQWIAVDPESGREYRWKDVVTFEEDLPEVEKRRLFDAFSTTSLIREAIFLLCGGQSVRLSDIPPGGVWVSLARRESDRATFRVTVHTRFQGSFDFSVGLAEGLDSRNTEREILWAMVAGESAAGDRLVEEMGGSWPDRGFWTKEALPGETVERSLRRLARRVEDDGVDRVAPMWPFMAWSAAEALFRFWDRTGRRYVIDDASPTNVIVPTHDYQVGARIVSVVSRTRSPGLASYLRTIIERLLEGATRAAPETAGLAGPRVIFSALLEAIGPEEGLELLRGLEDADPELDTAIRRYVDDIVERGFLPRRLYFAIKRYKRWVDLAEDATSRAKAQTLQDLWATYNIASLLGHYPEARVRFFLETVFADAGDDLRRGLADIVQQLRHRRIDNEELVDMIGALGKHGAPGSDEEFFLTRLTFPHLRPGDTAGFVSAEWGGVRQSDVVVTLRDNQGRPFHVRAPVSPKEVGRLHRLFIASRMEVTFSPEHHFLVAVNDRGVLIGGLFYDLEDEANGRAHLEKIVVSERYRKHGVADALMNELMSRLGAQGIHFVTTGFYRPSYFYRHGFRVERRYAGLVRELEPESYNPEIL